MSIIFNPEFYRTNNSDLYSLPWRGVELLQHFQKYGVNEGRTASLYFNVKYYRDRNPDLLNFDYKKAAEHYARYGQYEGRFNGIFMISTSLGFSKTYGAYETNVPRLLSVTPDGRQLQLIKINDTSTSPRFLEFRNPDYSLQWSIIAPSDVSSELFNFRFRQTR